MGPIIEIRLEMMDQDNALKARNYLEGQLHCRMTYMSEGYYLVKFPDGTVEEECPEPNPRYREETVIKLPNGAMLRKCVKWPCLHLGCTHIRLLIPEGLEETPRRMKYGTKRELC